VVTGDLVFAVPGDLDTPTGGYAYDKRMIAELGALGWRVEVLNIGEGFPYPSAATKAKAEALLAAVRAGRRIVIDGLAFGVLPDAAARLGASHPLIALVHHPLALETGGTSDEVVALRTSERAALACTRAVIANSPVTARTLVTDYDVAADCITVAPPGTDRPQTVSRRDTRTGTVALLAVGAVVPRKGYDDLVAALATLPDLDWRLVIAGDATRDATAARLLRSQIVEADLSGRITLKGAVRKDELAQLYVSADLFVLPSHYEGFGMAFAEAIAHGLPVIGTTAGAIVETVPAEAGILVPPGGRVALAVALRRLIADRAERARLAAGARAAANKLPTWRGSAELFSAAIERAT
jgi:glycosyltransferase involved in cell wall biosynthesis